jgi:hypothetical protein
MTLNSFYFISFSKVKMIISSEISSGGFSKYTSNLYGLDSFQLLNVKGKVISGL